jgi:hypothetical protein
MAGLISDEIKQTTFLSIKFSGNVQQREEFNKAIRDWSFETKNILAKNVREVATKGKIVDLLERKDGTIEKKLNKSIAYNLNKDKTKLIERVRFSFERHGVFLEKGVGNGTREAKVWFNDSMDKQLAKLADIASKYAVQFNVNKMSIKIK